VPSTPSVEAINPIYGPEEGGTLVTITGTGFTGATAVNFGATAATSFNVNSDTTIVATSPAHAVGVVDVTVVGPGGTSATGSFDHFTYIPPDPIFKFDGTSSSDSAGRIVNWDWFFDDQTTQTGPIVAKQYIYGSGVHPITLMVTDDRGRRATVSHSVDAGALPQPSTSTPTGRIRFAGSRVESHGGSSSPSGDLIWGGNTVSVGPSAFVTDADPDPLPPYGGNWINFGSGHWSYNDTTEPLYTSADVNGNWSFDDTSEGAPFYSGRTLLHYQDYVAVKLHWDLTGFYDGTFTWPSGWNGVYWYGEPVPGHWNYNAFDAFSANPTITGSMSLPLRPGQHQSGSAGSRVSTISLTVPVYTGSGSTPTLTRSQLRSMFWLEFDF
jgi:hypothetical protein